MDKIKDSKGELMTRLQRALLAFYFVVFVPPILYLLVATWPISGTDIDPGKVEYFHGWLTISLSMEARVLLLVILSGALGAYIHFGTSYVYFAGRHQLHKVFTMWYLLRPFIGAALACITYFVFRGLLFNAGATTSDINLYGMVAIAGLAGMFSKQVIEVLRKVADELFSKLKDFEMK